MAISKYYVFTDNGIFCDFNLSRLNKKFKSAYKNEDFKILGSDRVLYVSNEDITYQRDLNYLSQIPMSILYKTDKKPLLFSLLNLIFIIVTLLQVAGTRSLVSNLIHALGGGG